MKPELLMPAGSLKKERICFQYGADAVYAGIPQLSLRARENEFDLIDLEIGINEAHSQNKKFYLTANVFARNLKLKMFRLQLDQWAKFKPDALIMSDPGLIAITKEAHPEIPIHLSVQANCTNWEAVKFWQKVGVSRIILSRELRLEEIKKIKEKVPDIELEAFVHGSICIAYSGRCLLSYYMNYRDANQGVCDNSCRYPYKLYELKDERNPEEMYPVEEDQHGTYIMNSKDLCLIEHLREIKEAGVCSFKVEGRTKSEFYAGMISKLYREAIDDMESGKKFNPELSEKIQVLSARGYHKGFMMNQVGPGSQDYHPKDRSSVSHFLGILDKSQGGDLLLDVRNKIKVGDTVKLVYPDSEESSLVEKIYDLKGQEKEMIHSGSGQFKVVFQKPISNPCLVMKT